MRNNGVQVKYYSSIVVIYRFSVQIVSENQRGYNGNKSFSLGVRLCWSCRSRNQMY